MNLFHKLILPAQFAAACLHAALQPDSLDAIHSGVAWYDQNGNTVSAHGAGLLKEGERFYWEAKNATYGSKGDYVSVQKILLVE